MITDTRVRTLARQDGVTAGLAEKNYVNSWILYALYTGPFDNSLVFKGGTALSKLYFPDVWRFSEDLDFTATEPLPDVADDIDDALTDIEPVSGITFELTSVHEAGDPAEYVQLKVQYDAVLGQRNTTDIDITFNESLAFPIQTHEHSYEDIPTFTVPAYSVEEIFVEKLRSIYQRARARDYYDIYRLLQQETFDDQTIHTALQEKAVAHDVDLDLANGLPDGDIDAVEAYWDQALDRLVTEHIPFDDVVETVDQYLQELAAPES
jgi:predicted nucleotidyltransferase component of viral defense system